MVIIESSVLKYILKPWIIQNQKCCILIDTWCICNINLIMIGHAIYKKKS